MWAPMAMTLTLAVMLPAAAQAQVAAAFSGSVTLGYSRSSIGILPGVSARLGGPSLDFSGDLRFDGGLSVGLDFGLGQRRLSVAGFGTGVQFELARLSLEPSYHFGNGAYAGLYYRMGDLDLSVLPLPITVGADTRTYGLFGGYESGPLWVEGYIGRSNTRPSLPGGIRVRDYGVAASYGVSPQLDVFGSALRTDVDAGGIGISLTALSVGGEYDFGNNLSAYASLGRLNLDLNLLGRFGATGATLGAAYRVSAMGTPMVLNAEVSRTNLDLSPLPVNPRITRLSVGLTIPLGEGAATPLNSNTRTARGASRSVIGALIGSF